MNRMRRDSAATTVIALFCLAAGAWAADGAEFLGTTASNDVRLDGHAVPSATTLLSPSLLATDELPAIVHLRGGRNVALAAGSEALVELSETGEIRLAVRAGALELSEPGGVVVRLASNESHLLAADGIGEGAVVEMVAMCTMDEDKDRWVLVNVPATEVEARLAAGDIRAGKEHNDLGLDEECDDEGAVPLFTTSGKVVAGLSGVVVLGLLDEHEASP